MFDFDNATGLLSNPITIVGLDDTLGEIYGLSFSGNNSKLYVGRYLLTYDIYQYNLTSGIPSTIIASRTIIASVQSAYGQLQLGKDFKIYIANSGSPSISVIHNPNVLETACGYSGWSV